MNRQHETQRQQHEGDWQARLQAQQQQQLSEAQSMEATHAAEKKALESKIAQVEAAALQQRQDGEKEMKKMRAVHEEERAKAKRSASAAAWDQAEVSSDTVWFCFVLVVSCRFMSNGYFIVAIFIIIIIIIVLLLLL